MKVITYLFGLMIFMSCATKQIEPIDKIELEYFIDTQAYLEDQPTGRGFTQYKERGRGFIRIDGIYNSDTNLKNHTAEKAWAIRVKDDYRGDVKEILYVNLDYAKKYRNPGVYVRLDVVGKINAIFIDDDNERLLGSGRIYSGGGLAGALTDQISNSGDSWGSNKGRSKKILILRTDLDFKVRNGTSNAIAKALTIKNFNVLLGMDLSKKQLKRISFEGVKKIIEKLNIE